MGRFYCNNSIFERTDLSPTEKLAYIYFCRCANKRGESFRAYKTIAQDCGFSRRHAIRVVAKLVELGLVVKLHRTRQSGGRSSNLYIVQPLGNDVTRPVTKAHGKGKDKRKISNIRTSPEVERKKELIRALYNS